MPVINVCDALRAHRDVLTVAKELGCSRGYIYKVLKANGLTPADVINKGNMPTSNGKTIWPR